MWLHGIFYVLKGFLSELQWSATVGVLPNEPSAVVVVFRTNGNSSGKNWAELKWKSHHGCRNRAECPSVRRGPPLVATRIYYNLLRGRELRKTPQGPNNTASHSHIVFTPHYEDWRCEQSHSGSVVYPAEWLQQQNYNNYTAITSRKWFLFVCIFIQLFCSSDCSNIIWK